MIIWNNICLFLIKLKCIRMIKNIFCFSAAALLFVACNNSNDENTTDSVLAASDTSMANAIPNVDTANPDPAHNSQNSVDWAGTYYGVLPCADCPGIETTVTLKDNLTYIKETRYQGDKAKGMTPEKEEGSFMWDADGQKIILNGIKDASNQYFVGENVLYTLDMNGKRVTGPMEKNYTLKKKN